MNKVKIKTGLASIIVVACLFGGWQTMLLIPLLILIFCEIDDKVKDIMVKVIAFSIGVAIVRLGWNVIYSSGNLLTSALTEIISSTATNLKLFSIYKVNSFVVSPISKVLSYADRIVGILLSVTELFYVLSILTNKPAKSNPISKFVNKQVTKVINYMNGLDLGFTTQAVAPVQVAPVPQVAPVQVAPAVLEPVVENPTVPME